MEGEGHEHQCVLTRAWGCHKETPYLACWIQTEANSCGGFDFCSLHLSILGLVYFAGAGVVLAVVSDVQGSQRPAAWLVTETREMLKHLSPEAPQDEKCLRQGVKNTYKGCMLFPSLFSKSPNFGHTPGFSQEPHPHPRTLWSQWSPYWTHSRLLPLGASQVSAEHHIAPNTMAFLRSQPWWYIEQRTD